MRLFKIFKLYSGTFNLKDEIGELFIFFDNSSYFMFPLFVEKIFLLSKEVIDILVLLPSLGSCTLDESC